MSTACDTSGSGSPLTSALRAEFVTQSSGLSIDVKPEKMYFFLAIGEGSRFVFGCFLPTSAKTFIYQMPGRPTKHITDRGVSTDCCDTINRVGRTSGGDPNQRVPFRFHYGVVGFVDRCLPRILIEVGFSPYSLPQQGFLNALTYFSCAAGNSSPPNLSRDM